MNELVGLDTRRRNGDWVIIICAKFTRPTFHSCFLSCDSLGCFSNSPQSLVKRVLVHSVWVRFVSPSLSLSSNGIYCILGSAEFRPRPPWNGTDLTNFNCRGGDGDGAGFTTLRSFAGWRSKVRVGAHFPFV